MPGSMRKTSARSTCSPPAPMWRSAARWPTRHWSGCAQARSRAAIFACGRWPDRRAATTFPAARNRPMIRLPGPYSIFALALLLVSGVAQSAAPIPVYGYKIVHTYPHDTSAYTEGLFYKGGYLYESTGEVGQSTLRKVE